MPLVVVGKDCKLYIGTAGTQANTLFGNVRDVTLNLERREIDASARDSGDFEEAVPGMISASVDVEIRWKPSDTNFQSLRTAFLAGTAISCLILDGLKTVAGSQGLDGDFMVVSMSRPEPLNDLLVANVRLKPTPSTRQQSWFVAT